MTKKQREAVVELLRCSADVGEPISFCGMLEEYPQRIIELALQARIAVCDWCTNPNEHPPSWVEQLEAAQRVDERSWP